ncbi:inactive tyrosine-protein kinase 7-like [Ostrea edulis]|uniref:inactive tyrosine-protein kinase 7-like n=1 Tax=Ostrea edulis TaxID=37623 RepID=UPI0024AF2531|nr:inactive tyrosine-protein kinase 7-like [Ostrea edulis]
MSLKGEMQGTYLFILLILSEGILSLRVITEPELYVTVNTKATIVLNCTYIIENSESVFYIDWRRKHGTDYNTIVRFIPDKPASFKDDGIYLKNRTDLVNPGHGSNSVILKINDVMCEDAGHYRCEVTSSARYDSSDTSVFIQADAVHPIKFTIYPNGSLEENDTVTLSCYANVGNPEGYIAIWRVDKTSTSAVLLNETNIVRSKTENCTTLINATVTYTVSRNDNGAFFRCSSQNRQTLGTAPSRDTNPINVLYVPSKLTIFLTPNKKLYVGDGLQLTCISDGNPPPRIKWKFHPDNCTNSTETFQSSNGTLKIYQLKLEDSGVFCCLASNTYGENYQSILQIYITVWDIVIPKPTCAASPCGITEICNETHGKVVCTVNNWVAVAFVSVLLATGFCVTTIVLLCRRRQLNKKATNDEEYEAISNLQLQERDTENARYEALNIAAQTST